jgi:hypothetical protein
VVQQLVAVFPAAFQAHRRICSGTKWRSSPDSIPSDNKPRVLSLSETGLFLPRQCSFSSPKVSRLALHGYGMLSGCLHSGPFAALPARTSRCVLGMRECAV